MSTSNHWEHLTNGPGLNDSQLSPQTDWVRQWVGAQVRLGSTGSWDVAELITSPLGIEIERPLASPGQPIWFHLSEVKNLDELRPTEAGRQTVEFELTDGRVIGVFASPVFVEYVIAALTQSAMMTPPPQHVPPVPPPPYVGSFSTPPQAAPSLHWSGDSEPGRPDRRITGRIGIASAIGLVAVVLILGFALIRHSDDRSGQEDLSSAVSPESAPTSEATSSHSGSTSGATSVQQWVLDNPNLPSDMTEGAQIMESVSSAAEDYSMSRVTSGCTRMLAWGERMQTTYGDSPLALWKPTFDDVVAGAEACLDGDLTTSAAYISSASAGFEVMTAQIS